MHASTRSLILLTAVLAPSLARAQDPARAPYLVMRESSPGLCRQLSRPRGTAFCVVGEAFDSSGVAKVTANGVDARLGPDTSLVRAFTAWAPAPDSAARVTVELVMTTKAGGTASHLYAITAVHDPGQPDFMLSDLQPRVLGGDASTNVAVVTNPAPAATPLPPPAVADATAVVTAPAPPVQPVAAPNAPDSTGAPQVSTATAQDTVPVTAAPGPAPVVPAPEPVAQEGPNSYLRILRPVEWSGTQARTLEIAPRNGVPVSGEAQLPAGVSRVEVNGVPTSLSPLPGGAVHFAGYAVPRSPGANDVEVVVRGNTGPLLVRHYTLNVAPAGAAPAVSAPVSGRRFAVVVGVSEYADTAIPRLRYADADAKAFYDFLRSERAGGGGFAQADVRLLLNEQATYREIRSALFTFLQAATPADQVVIYFAGHGADDQPRSDNLYLLPYNAERNDLPGTGFPMDDVRKAVRALHARDILVITDACHAAGVADEVTGRGMDGVTTRGLEGNAINGVLLQQLAASSGGLAIFTASGVNQLSQEDERWGGGHGVFTYHLIQALNGAADADSDHVVTLTEMMEYTREHVKADTHSHQIPSISQTSYNEFMPMSVAGEVTPPSPPPPADTVAPSPPADTVAPPPSPPQLDAIARFRLVVEQYPASAVYRVSLGRALRDAGLLDEAVVQFSEAVRLEPHDASYNYDLGVTLHRDGKVNDAIAYLEEAARLDGRSAAVFNAAGAALLDVGRAIEAVERFRRAVRLEVANPVYHRDLGFALEKADRSGDAVAEYRMASALAPDSAAFRRALARALQASNHLPEAIAELREAVRVAPADAENHHALGLALRDAPRADSAVIELKEAAHLAPRNAVYHHDLGTLYRDVGRVADAVPELREAAQLAPANADYHYDLGMALLGAQQAQAAAVALEQAVRADSLNARNHDALGQARKAAGEPQAAMAAFRAAIHLAPDNAQYHYDLGVFLRDLGMFAESLAEFQSAVGIDGTTREYREALNGVRRRIPR